MKSFFKEKWVWMSILCMLYITFLTQYAQISAKASSQSPNPNDTPVASPISITQVATTTVPTLPQPTAMNFSIPYDQWKDIQTDILETTRKTSETTLSTVTILLGVMTFFVTALAAVAGYTGFKVYVRLSDAAKRADGVVQTVEDIKTNAQQIQNQQNQQFDSFRAQIQDETQKFHNQIENYSSEITELHSNFEYIDKGMEGIKKEIQDVDNWRKGIKHDMLLIRDSITMVNLEERSVELFSDDPKEVQEAIVALIQMTDKQYKAFIRKRAVDLLGQYILITPNESILECLRKSAATETSKIVKNIAENAVKEYGTNFNGNDQ